MSDDEQAWKCVSSTQVCVFLTQNRSFYASTSSTLSVIADSSSYFTGVHTNQDLIWCVKIGVYMGFWVYRRF